MRETERPGSAVRIDKKIEEIDQLIQEIDETLADTKDKTLRKENRSELKISKKQFRRDRRELYNQLERIAMGDIQAFVEQYVPSVETSQVEVDEAMAEIEDHEAAIALQQVQYGEDHVDFLGETFEDRLKSARALVDEAFAA